MTLKRWHSRNGSQLLILDESAAEAKAKGRHVGMYDSVGHHIVYNLLVFGCTELLKGP